MPRRIARRLEASLPSGPCLAARSGAVSGAARFCGSWCATSWASARLPEITGELSALADAILETALSAHPSRSGRRFGKPLTPGGEEARFAVIALGKLGGSELNYSSDIDLMFLYSENGETTGPARITNKEFFKRAANQLTALLSTYTAEGLCYRVDLRLRPDGSLGEVCISLEGARQYYAKRARDWELQMLIKARVAAGDRATGRALLDFVEPRIYSTTLDFSAIEALSATRERMNEKLWPRNALEAARGRTAAQIDVKLERGGIRDIEFVVQCLQRLYGGAEPWVRHGGTLLALARLQDKGFLSDAEYGRLASAYQFLRHLEHRLQFADDRQTHTLARRPEPSLSCSRGACRAARGRRRNGCWRRRACTSQQVIEIYERVVHAGSATGESAAEGRRRRKRQRGPRAGSARAARCRRAGGKRICDADYRAFEHFLERLSAEPGSLEQLDANPDSHALHARSVRAQPLLCRRADPHAGTGGRNRRASHASKTTASPTSMTELRRWFRRRDAAHSSRRASAARIRFSIRSRDTSELADAVIARAYEIAIAEVARQRIRPPIRLSTRRTRCGSSRSAGWACANSISPPTPIWSSFWPIRDAAEMRFWTRVAERFIDLITAYTGEGILFAVDTRLAAQRQRRSAGADRKRVQGLFRTRGRGVGRHHVHEIAGGGRRSRPRGILLARIAGSRLAALRPERPFAHGPAADAHATRKGTRRTRIPSRPAAAAITISILC